MTGGSKSLPAWRTRSRPTIEATTAPPAGSPVAPAAPRARRHPSRHATSPATDHGLRVLMVDDSDIVRKVTGRMLEKLGCVIEYATNGSQAVEMCLTGDYDLVLMDCQMPVMDGPSAARVIRARSAAEKLRIVAFTANILEENRRACIDAGMDGFVTKPLVMDELIDVLADIG